MSHKIKDEKDIKPIIDIMNSINKEGINYDIIEHTLKLLIPKDENNNNLTNYVIYKRKYIEYASFNPKYNTITMSIDGIKKYIEKNIKIFNDFNIKSKKLYSYIYIYTFAHEIEHSIQFLMKDNIIKTPLIIEKAYKELFNIIIKKESIFPNPIKDTHKHISYLLYQLHHDNYLLERNACIEGYDLLLKIAIYLDDKELIRIFNHLKDYHILIGYNNNYNGSIEETFKKILMYYKIKKYLLTHYNMSYEDKIRYGLPITEEEKKLLLKK